MDIKQILNTAVGGYSLSKILSALVTLLVCLIAVRLIMKVVTRLLSRMQKINERLQKIIHTSIKALLYVLTVIITAEALGVNTSSLTALLSVLTLGITLAAEDILGNVAGGLVILSSHPFALGDFIEAGGTSGTVREIGLNHTKLETANGQMILMPNKDLSSSKIINYTVLGRRRIVRTVTASYDAPTETVPPIPLKIKHIPDWPHFTAGGRKIQVGKMLRAAELFGGNFVYISRRAARPLKKEEVP